MKPKKKKRKKRKLQAEVKRAKREIKSIKASREERKKQEKHDALIAEARAERDKCFKINGPGSGGGSKFTGNGRLSHIKKAEQLEAQAKELMK